MTFKGVEYLFTGVNFLHSYQTKAKRVLGKTQNLKLKKNRKLALLSYPVPLNGPIECKKSK